MIPQWKLLLIAQLGERLENGEKLTFIHTPKCAGTYADNYLKDLKIANKGHRQADRKKDGVTFSIIREPISRFESLLNFRLTKKKVRKDWPAHLRYLLDDEKVTLNRIVEHLSDGDIAKFRPYKTLKHWSSDVDLLLTVDEFLPTLQLWGYDVSANYPKKNVSRKDWGIFDTKTIERLTQIYQSDIELFEYWTRGPEDQRTRGPEQIR